ncbi:hypothetical protein COEREDRAFT_88062 [Coemansia reversa NRRL 1564]|uniref:Uncharacterized protein n=1 Tax=Coemansia reversa (strain ATCC 12441 / NRRL 1564) TaxID=763665 RepID=A0A2G5B860_COERN|nr:hypothetical protein COEREDRAFT_88062 [Coemansia reversa NRRL 1564]|eukprot:PIA15208.1 hypothetical protein COEREDRAFT_88062 [Coemansia reversa NRRL 1564]
MYPPDNGSTYSGHSYGSYNSGYPPIDDLNRSLGSQGSNGGLGNKRYSQVNNPAVGAGPMSTQMPSAPAGFNFSGGPGGFNGPGGFSDPGGFMVPPPHSNGFGGGSSYPPPPGGGYPPANNMYPPPGGGGHPPANNMYPPGNNMYPPANNGGYPPANNNSHPPRNGGYPPMGGGYSQPPLPPRNQFDSGYPPRASCGGGNQRPPASAGPGMSGPGNNSSMQSVNGPKPSPINQSAPELNKQTPARPPPQDGGGPRPSSYRPTGSSSVGSIPPAQNNVNRGMYWSPVNSQ